MEVNDNMYISKSRLFFLNIFVSASVFLSCSIPQQKTQTKTFSPILVRRYNAEVDLGMEQISNNPLGAIEYFNSAIKKDLNWPEAFSGRGLAWLKLEMYTNAIMDFDLALEANWSLYDVLGHKYNASKSNIYLLRAMGRIGLLKTIDAQNELETWILTRFEITTDLNLAEMFAGWAGDHELMKQIIETRHLFESGIAEK